MQCTIRKNIKKTSLPHKKIISPVQHQQPIVRNGLQPSTAASANLILAVKGSKPSTTCIPQKNDTGRSKSMCIEIEVLPTEKRYILWMDWADIKINVQKTGTIRAHQEHESFLTIVNEKCIWSALLAISNYAKRVFRNVIQQPKGWRNIVDIDQCPQWTQHILDECDNRLTDGDIKPFYSEHGQNTHRLFQMSSERSFVSECEILEKKDYLLTVP